MRVTYNQLRNIISEALKEADSTRNGLVDFIVRSNQIEGYDVDPEEVREAIDGVDAGYPLTYVTNNPHIYSHLAGIEVAKGGVGSVGDVVRIHGAMGADALDAGAPGVLRSGVEAQSAGGTKYVPSADVPDALSWWSKQTWVNPFEAHTVYELIHPFADGNGRSGRIILAAMMGFNYGAVNGLIGSGYFSNLDSVGSKYQGKFWKQPPSLVEFFGVGGNKPEIVSLDGIETVGDLKTVIKAAMAAKKKGAVKDAATAGIKDAVVDELMGKIPGASLVKGLFGVARAAYDLDDSVKIGTGLSFLNVDDDVAAIVDDAVEDKFLKNAESDLERMADTTPLSDVNMTAALSKYLGKEFNTRTVKGFPEK